MNMLSDVGRLGLASGVRSRWSHLDALEAEAIHILREVAAECTNVALLFSGGKDSAVVLRLAEKAFFPERVQFTLLQIVIILVGLIVLCCAVLLATVPVD